MAGTINSEARLSTFEAIPLIETVLVAHIKPAEPLRR